MEPQVKLFMKNVMIKALQLLYLEMIKVIFLEVIYLYHGKVKEDIKMKIDALFSL